MPTKVKVPSPFLRELKKLAKKYPSLLKQFETLTEHLRADERPGDKVPRVGHDVYKVRLANPSAKRGKSGGFRVVYYVQLVDTILLVTIYSKTEQVDITPEEIRAIIEEITKEFDENEP